MAKLDHMPSLATIVAQRGRVDYYFWKGIPVARSWPRKSTQPRSAGEKQSSAEFTAAAKITGALPGQIQELYEEWIVPGVAVTWVDFVRSLCRAEKWILER